MESYQVCTGSGNGRGKNYYFDNLQEAIEKAKKLQKRRKDGNPSIIIKGETSPGGFISYYTKNRILY